MAGHLVQETVSIYALLRGLGPTYSAFIVGITSNLVNLSFEDVVVQINSRDELMNFSSPQKDATHLDFPPAANQTQVQSPDQGRGCNGGRNRG